MNSKNRNLFLVLGIVLVLGLIVLVVFMRPAPEQVERDPVLNDFPELFVDREDLLFEERVTKIVSELKRSPAARFSIVIQGNVRDFFDRTIIVEAREETLEVLVAEGAVVVTEVRPEPPILEELAEFPPEEFILFDLLMLIEMAIEEEFLPDVRLEEFRDQIRERLPDIPAEEIPGLFAPLPPGEVRLEPFLLEDISIGDIVVIQAKITPIGELRAFEVIVTPID